MFKMKSTTIKYISIVIILFAANIMLSMIEEQIQERSSNRHHAKSLVEKSWTGDQTIFAAILKVPYQQKKVNRVFDKELDKYVERISWSEKSTFILPDNLILSGKLTHQTLSKGIYKVPVYNSEITLNGNLSLDKLKTLAEDKKIRLLNHGFLSIGIFDSRGISGSPLVKVNGKAQQVLSGTNLDFFGSGFHSKVSLLDKNKPFNFDINIQVKGMGSINFLATAKENNISITSDWKHPSFIGSFLPVKRDITDNGYSAKWKTGVFSTNIENTIEKCFSNDCSELYVSSFGVNHIQSVDIYLKSLRSVKYGLLVVIITFTLFVLYEVLNTGVRIHPISYLLTGMALAIFFLLLVALSEHISFALSYWISSIACAGLIGYYVRYLSDSKMHGASMFGLLNSFYLVLFFIIRSEDHALLSGSILLFVLLTTVIVVTKNVDWYKMGKQGQ